MSVQTRATLDDLARTEGKAELIGGRVVDYMPSGYLPSRVAKRILLRLEEFAQRTGAEALGDGMGYAVPELPSGRE